MGTVTLQVTMTNGAGVEASWIRIDAKSVEIRNGKGTIDVDGSALQQTFSYWFLGDSGSKLTFEIKQDNRSLKKVEDAIAVGFDRAVGSGHFKLKSPEGLW